MSDDVYDDNGLEEEGDRGRTLTNQADTPQWPGFTERKQKPRT